MYLIDVQYVDYSVCWSYFFKPVNDQAYLSTLDVPPKNKHENISHPPWMQMYLFCVKLGIFRCHVSELRFFFVQRLQRSKVTPQSWLVVLVPTPSVWTWRTCPKPATWQCYYGRKDVKDGCQAWGKMSGWGLIGPLKIGRPHKGKAFNHPFSGATSMYVSFREAKQWGRFFSLTLGENPTNYTT